MAVAPTIVSFILCLFARKGVALSTEIDKDKHTDQGKLSWDETYAVMARSDEDWSDWNASDLVPRADTRIISDLERGHD